MATLEELETKFLKAHRAGDKKNAGIIAAEIKRRRGASGWMGQGAAGLIEGVASIPGALGDVQAATGGAARSVAEFFGASPETAGNVDWVARRLAFPGFVNQMPTTEQLVKTAEPVTGPLPAYEDGTTGQQYLRTVGRIAPSAVVGPGRAAVKAASGVGAGLLSELAGQMTEGSVFETPARIAGAVAGGITGGGAVQALQQPRAPFAGIPAGSQERVARGLADEFNGNVDAAVARRTELGPDALVMNLGARPAGQGITIARQPTPGMPIIKNALKEQRANAPARVEADWNAAMGPGVSRYGNRLQKAAAQAGTDDVYEIARGRPVDPSPVQSAIMQARQEAGNDRTTLAAINDIAEMIPDPRTGNLVPGARGRMVQDKDSRLAVADAGGLVNIRQTIDQRIREIGARLTNNPADDVYQLGSRTTTGRQLMKIRRSINETLHQDKELAAADATFSSAERVSEAFDKGRTRLLGSGDRFIEPDALRAWLDSPRVSVAEKEALLRGMSQRGRQDLRDIRPNRNEGAAFGNAIATPNNLARIQEAAGPRAAGIVRNMAKREDTFAKDQNRALAQSVTSDVMLGSQEFPSPVMGPQSYANASQVTLPGIITALTAWAANKATGGYIAQRRTRIAEGAAKLLASKADAMLPMSNKKSGDVVRQLMGYAAQLEQGDPVRDLIMRALMLSRNAPTDNPTVQMQPAR